MDLPSISVSYICLLFALLYPQLFSSALLPPTPSARPILSNDNKLLLPDLPTNFTALNLTTLTHALPRLHLTNYVPQCWASVPRPQQPTLIMPIEDPSDCYEAILLVIQDADPDAPILWYSISAHAWHYESCSIYLRPVRTQGSSVVRDTFSRGEITRQVLAVQILCVTEQMRYLGGGIKVGGKGVFEVFVMDGILERGGGKGLMREV